MGLNKKAQIGSTLTWIVAAAIIFFLMILFLIIAGTIANAKNIPLVKYLSSYERNEINILGIESKGYESEAGNILFSFINYKSNSKDLKIKYLIDDFAFSEDYELLEILENESKKYADSFSECVYICLNFYKDNSPVSSKKIVGKDCPSFQYSCTELSYTEDYQLSKFDKKMTFKEKEVKYSIYLYRLARQ